MPSPQDGNGQALETPFGETLVLEPTSPGRAEARERPPASVAASPFVSEFCTDAAADEADGPDRAPSWRSAERQAGEEVGNGMKPAADDVQTVGQPPAPPVGRRAGP